MNKRIKLVFEFFGLSIDTGTVKPENGPTPLEKTAKEERREIPVTDSLNNKSDAKVSTEDKKIGEVSNLKFHNKDKQVQVVPEDKTKVHQITPNKAFNLTVDLEKISGKGEDSPATLIQFDDDSTVIGVADGMGGAGGTIYEIDDGKHSGAYLASRAVISIAEKYFAALITNGAEISSNTQKEIASELKQHINTGLSKILEKIEKRGNPKLKIKSSLIKKLPTTFAIAHLKSTDKQVEINNFWAGDSRIYVLDPNEGLQQLTIDDLVDKNDAFENLVSDSPISNCVNADRDYKINIASHTVKVPSIIFAATDGAFGYLQTPIHFEYLLLNTLLKASTIEEWKSKLIVQLQRDQSDDISIALSVVGCSSFSDLKHLFRKRSEILAVDIEELTDTYRKTDALELSMRETVERNQRIQEEINRFEMRIRSLGDLADQIERSINDAENEFRKTSNLIEQKIRELNELEKKREDLKRRIDYEDSEFEKVKADSKDLKSDLSAFKKQNRIEENTPEAKELKGVKDTRDKLKRALWQKYKAQYERYLKNIDAK